MKKKTVKKKVAKKAAKKPLKKAKSKASEIQSKAQSLFKNLHGYSDKDAVASIIKETQEQVWSQVRSRIAGFTAET